MLKKLILLFLMIIFSMTVFSGCNTKNTEKNNNGNDDKKIKSLNKKIIEPSDLITKEEAENLINDSLKDGEVTEQKVVGQKLCLYNSTDDNSSNFLQVGITQRSFMEKDILDSGQTPKTIYEGIRDNFEDTLESVDEIGDESFIATGGIYIISGDYFITIGVGNTDNEENIEILKKAGEMAVKKL